MEYLKYHNCNGTTKDAFSLLTYLRNSSKSIMTTLGGRVEYHAVEKRLQHWSHLPHTPHQHYQATSNTVNKNYAFTHCIFIRVTSAR